MFTKGNNVEQTHFSVTAEVSAPTINILTVQLHSLQVKQARSSVWLLAITKPMVLALSNTTGNNKDEDGYESDNFSINASVPLGDNINVGATGLF